MDRKQTVIILLLVVAFAIFVHGLKTLRHNRFAAEARTAMNVGEVDDTPYHVTNKEMAEDRARSGRSARTGMKLSAVSQFNQYDFGGAKVVAADAKAKETIKKKKKKKAGRDKKDGKDNIISQMTRPYYAETPRNTIQDDNSNNTDSGGYIRPPTADVGAGDPQKPDNSESTYQDWAPKLMPTPSPANVAKLILAYKAGSVPADVFYQLLEAMYAENNAEQQSLAIGAAGQTPSVLSFAFLVKIEKSNPSSANSALVQTAFTAYQAIGEVHVLAGVMTAYMSDATSIQIATQLVLASAETNINGRAPTAVPGATTAPTQTTVVQAFSGFSTVLQTVIKTYANNATISQAATQALALINSVVPVVTH